MDIQLGKTYIIQDRRVVADFIVHKIEVIDLTDTTILVKNIDTGMNFSRVLSKEFNTRWKAIEEIDGSNK